MRFIFSTGSLYTYGIDRCFELAAAAGFDGMEVMADRRWDTRQPAYLLRLADRESLPIVAVHVPLETDAASGWPNDTPGRIRETLLVAEAVGAAVVIHHLPLRFRTFWLILGRHRLPLPLPGQDAYQRWLLEEYVRLQGTTRVTLCIENMPAFRKFGLGVNLQRWNHPAEIVRFPHLTLDTTHLGTWGMDPAEVYDQLGGRVRHVHLSNFDDKEHRRPEAGRLCLDRFLARLSADGYTGAVSLEMSPDALNAGQPDAEVVGLLTRSLAYCRRAVQEKQAHFATAAAGSPSSPPQAPSPR
jgi:sugar phosphate isomerase/epimerase